MLPTTTRPVNQDTCVNIDAPDNGGVEYLIREINYVIKRNENRKFLVRVLKCVLAYERVVA